MARSAVALAGLGNGGGVIFSKIPLHILQHLVIGQVLVATGAKNMSLRLFIGVILLELVPSSASSAACSASSICSKASSTLLSRSGVLGIAVFDGLEHPAFGGAAVNSLP